MKHQSALLAVATLALLGSPLVSRADAVEHAMDACVQAFVAASLPKGQRVVVDKQDIASGPLDAHSRAYRLVLTATGTTSGRQIAKSTCIANRRGQPPGRSHRVEWQATASRRGGDCRNQRER
jgi:hypothetical protein